MMRVALTLWLLLWVRVAVPWRSFQSSPSFRRLEIIPFAGGTLRSHVLNALVFIPLGMIATRLGWPFQRALALGFCVSLATELLQLFSVRRYPSTTDVILNTLGTLAGILIAIAWPAREDRRPSGGRTAAGIVDAGWDRSS